MSSRFWGYVGLGNGSRGRISGFVLFAFVFSSPYRILDPSKKLVSILAGAVDLTRDRPSKDAIRFLHGSSVRSVLIRSHYVLRLWVHILLFFPPLVGVVLLLADLEY